MVIHMSSCRCSCNGDEIFVFFSHNWNVSTDLKSGFRCPDMNLNRLRQGKPLFEYVAVQTISRKNCLADS